MPTLRFSIGTGVTSAPSNSTSPPASGASSPAMMRSVVVLPQPDGPSRTTVSPAAMERSSGCSATVPSSNVFLQERRVMGIPLIGVLPGGLPAEGTRCKLQRDQEWNDDHE